jgi:nucleoside-diphosphate-sugar epimerase
VNGSHNALWCAGEAGVPKIVYNSSATVYGAHPDNDVPLTEESPLRANLDFSYPAHKLEVEYIIKEFKSEFADTVVTVMRPAIVFGESVDNAWSRVLESPVLFGVKGHRPPIQFVDEDDVARGLKFAVLDRDLDGPYNLSPEDWLGADEALKLMGRRRFEMSEPAAFSLLEALWSLGLSEVPAGMLHYLMHPWVLSSRKLQSAGFVCLKSSEDVFAETVERLNPYVRVGGNRLSRRGLRFGAAAGAAAITGLALLGGAARRRRGVA